MDRATILDAIDLESSRFLVAVSSGTASLETPVASCPGWDMAQLVNHLGVVYSRIALVVSSRRAKAPDRSQLPTAPDGEALIGWFAEQRTAMLNALEAADEETRVWNFIADTPGPVSFWGRRSTHETLIHRVDAELAQDLEPAPAMPEVAADTVSEFFELFFPRIEPKLVEAGLVDSLHLHASDVPGAEWTIEAGPGRTTSDLEHEKAGVALSGTAFELACWTWGRLPTGRLDVVGDQQIAERFQKLASS
jgi:uncharacterized protein (TIGR03083 family)